MELYKIKHFKTNTYYPCGNGQVEVTNKILGAVLTKILFESKQDWDEWLIEALWSYHTTFKAAVQNTPFNLVYGLKVILSIEKEMPTLCIALKAPSKWPRITTSKMTQTN